MSEPERDLDLDVLARAKPVARPKRRLWTRLLPVALLLAFAAIFASTLTDFGRSAVRVTVVRPQSAGDAGGAPLAETLQRSGWIEPDPFAVTVTALAAGVVREVLVLEGARVNAGQELVRLDDASARLDLARAETAVAGAQAEAERAEQERAIAEEAFTAALDVTEKLASARAGATAATAMQERRAAAAAQGGAALRIAQEELEIAHYLLGQGGAGPRQVELAQAKVEGEGAALAQLEAEAAQAVAEAHGAAAALVRAEQESRLRLDDRARLAAARGTAAAATAALAEAEAERAIAALTLERMTVRAPVDGIVLQRLVAPGSAVGSEGHPPVATLYDPTQLRVRVDVEQAEIARLAQGQAVAVRAPTRAEPYAGTVTRIVRQANVEKVTLQVHVALAAPDEALRPEMLVEARFELGSAAAVSSGAAAVIIPARLLIERDGATSVWVVDGSNGRATLRGVDGVQRSGDRARIGSGLNVSDKLIDAGGAELREGARLELVESGDRAEGGR
ncbi:MAG: efflux RND transporter periplasmic adaptor subunit [Planctomycetes bacterium]|nr:efflux RND transporter periplasmic adaptor subunit [Planctomycetota bacterium]